MYNAKILLVDDEKSIVQLIEMVLRKEGFRHIYAAYNGQEALELAARHSFDIILLDVMLPDQTGFELCPQIRRLSDAHIIYLTARTSDLDVLTGFATGGDDYVTKPFNPLEIAARVKARLRRTVAAAPAKAVPEESRGRYDFGRFVLDEYAGTLIVGGKEMPCPAQAYQLLLFLCKHPGIVFSKSQLYEEVWGIDGLGDDNTVMVHIRKIRERIEEDPGDPKLLVTVRGLGYKLMKVDA
ncbi:response regulator transcription factor [Paenibacillus sp. FSL M7-1455]|uniref:DNA-binding response regulator n=1 Tax=Paenibacillus cookii TaxID=157839 RepID=A0ABQ4M106_9BACL|nr:response regulator transcription factor [Paenibacillus cookii]KHF29670.1 Transcriptional regulatory protein YycF [Paenibacillus sp. P1XP2]GIO69217.1 DNA-binding response regulator [Paenibacillus cookii]HWO55257.1 response regulator transcription factor [Paenibacillus cookii]